MTESNLDNNFLGFLNQQSKPKPASKRSRRSGQFVEISLSNTAIVDELIALAEKLANDGRGTDAKQVIQIIRKLLDNNQRLQQVVSETLQDIAS